MEKLLPPAEEFEKEWVLEFHGTKYEINLGISSSVLSLDVEQEGTNDKWSAEFTSQYIEEITHKAGNFKKFDTFVMMLSSAFARESDTVFVDLLTYNDLELMKARKLGNTNTSSSFQSQNSVSSKSQMKRYVILTYNSEFDRVHFPLPLSYEDNPSVESLQRTIFRLKRREKERIDKEKDQLVSIKESRDLKFIDSQLRQENTELKHRLRFLENKMSKKGGDETFHNPEVGRLKKQVEQLKRALQDKCNAYDKLKADVFSMRTVKSEAEKAGSRDISSKVRQLQSTLEMERMDHRKEVSRLKRELSDLRRTSTYGTASSRSRRTTSSASRERDRLSTTTPRSSTASRSRSPLGDPSPARGRRSNTHAGYNPTSSRTSAARSSRTYGESSGYGQPSRRPTSAKSTGSVSARTTRSTYSRSPTAGSRNASRSRSPSSSLGGVFDPTAYAREKEEKKRRAQEARGRAWGAGAARDRYNRESGYSSASSGYNSATSQSSVGSARSRRSTGSNRSVRSTHSADSRDSAGHKKKKTSKSSKKSSKSKSPNRKRKTKRDHFHNHVGIGMMTSHDQMNSTALDLHLSENFAKASQPYHQAPSVEEVLGSYLQVHDDSENERVQREQQKILQLQQSQRQHQREQQQQHVKFRMEYERTEQVIAQKQQAYLKDAPQQNNGRPPLQSRTSYPIDDIEDDSDETDSNLGSHSDHEDNANVHADSTLSITHIQAAQDSTSQQKRDETQDIENLRSQLMQNVNQGEKSRNSSLASSMTSIKSASDGNIPDHKGLVRSFTDKENQPNVTTTPTTTDRLSTSNIKSPEEDDGEISDIDRRLSDLQKFLDKARSGIMAAAENTVNEST